VPRPDRQTDRRVSDRTDHFWARGCVPLRLDSVFAGGAVSRRRRPGDLSARV